MTSVEDSAEGSPLTRVDRHILLVTPREPFAEWVRSLEEFEDMVEGKQRSGLDESIRMPATYLVPFSFNPDPVIAWVRDNFDTIFETELNGVTDKSESWPSDRTVEMFEDWFDLQLFDAPTVVVDGPFYLSELPSDTALALVHI